LPGDELLKVAIAIADALDKAHRAGIIHRDLKPGNVMLTKSGAKLLDFGLAKSVSAAAGAASNSSASVFAAALTQTSPAGSPASPLSSAGAVIGTIQYMAPEQIQGLEADARSDIFGFGVMLYEMATGKRAFEGKTQSSIVGQILAVEPPPISSIQPLAPAGLSTLVRSCLEKDPNERFQTIHDVKLRLLEIAETQKSGTQFLAIDAPSRRTRLLWVSSVAVLVLALATMLGLSFVRKTPQPEVTRFQVDMGSLQIVLQAVGSRLTISPDGRTVVMTLHSDTSKPQLYARRLDSLDVTPLPGTEGATQPFFSPDSRWVGFSANGKLKKVPLAGGVPVTICDLPGADGSATWGDHGPSGFDWLGGAMGMVPADGGTPVRLDALKEPYRWPLYLPGSRALLATVRREGRFDIDLIRMDSHTSENVIRNGSWPRYLLSGRIVYAQYSSGADTSGFTGGLLSIPFDLKRLKGTGAPEPVLQEVQVGSGGAGFYDMSPNGTIAYISGAAETQLLMEMMWLDASGKVTPVGAPSHHYHDLRLSPDGNRVLFTMMDSSDIYTYDLARKTLQRLTFDKRSQSAVFTPDGKRIIYFSTAVPPQDLWSKPADGSGEAVRITHSEFSPTPDSVSPDGTTLAYTELHPGTGTDIYLASLQGDSAAHPLVNTQFSEGYPSFSPDGKFIAYFSNEAGERQIYVQSLQNSGKWQISSSEGSRPRWSRDGKKLFYMAEGRKLMSVDVNTNGSFTAGTPRSIFELTDFGHGGYDVTRDGRFIWAKSSASGSKLNVLRVIQNFDTEIARRVAAPQP
ncbi:MAG: prkC 32, partial [Candidatus Angelobacter sp.]|nr:prkC 32 [Candidatus Angelobacter sp.]